MRDEINQQAIVGHVVLQVRVRPVGAPEHAVGEALDDPARERHDVAIGMALAPACGRAGDAEPFPGT